jgi:hypothetical protein
MDINVTDRLTIINKNNIKLKNTNNNEKYNIKIHKIDLINKAFDLLENKDYIYTINSVVLWLGINYLDTMKILINYMKIFNIKIKDNFIIFEDKYKYLSINEHFINDDLYIIVEKFIIDEYLKYANNKNIIILKTKRDIKTSNIGKFTIFSKFINDDIKYKVKYITYNTKNNIRILPSIIHFDKLNNIKENINFDVGIFNNKILYSYIKNKKYISYFNDLNKIFYISMKNINKNGCFYISSMPFLHKNYYNFICHILNYFEKVIIMGTNITNTNYLSSFPGMDIYAINYNGKKFKKFDSKYNYNDNNSIKIKKEVYNYFLTIINKFINEYLNNKTFKNIKYIKDIDAKEMFLNNINNIKLYCLKYNIKTNILLNEYFKQYDNNLLFDLNYFIKICVQNNILNIYYLEHTEYTEYLVNLMIPQYEKKFKYLKYDKNTKILDNSLLYLNTDEKFYFKILLKFDNIIIKKIYANFFEDFYIKDENENYYFLNKNEFSVKNYKK